MAKKQISLSVTDLIKQPAKLNPVFNPATEKVRLDDRLRQAFPDVKPGLVTDIRALITARTPMPAGINKLQKARPRRPIQKAPNPQLQELPEMTFPMQQNISMDGAQLQGSSARQKLYRPNLPGWHL